MMISERLLFYYFIKNLPVFLKIDKDFSFGMPSASPLSTYFRLCDFLF